MTGPPARPSLLALFMGFLGIGVVGFGGVLPWLRRMMVERRRWLTPAEFNDLLALCQFLPGPNVVNMAVATGARFRGLAGSVICVTGLLVAPFAIVVVLGGLYDRYGQVPLVAHAFGGLAAGATGLIVATAFKIATPLERHWAGIAIAALSCAAVAVLRLPLLPVMLAFVPMSIAVCARWPKPLDLPPARPGQPSSGPAGSKTAR